MLESEGVDVGLVTSIVGIRRIEIAFEGEADHAGTTPMGLRRDALVAAARTVDSVRRAAEALAAEGEDYFVATVGILDVSPSASNVVPGRCRLIVDARSTSPDMTKRFAERIDRESADHAREARVRRTGFSVLSDGPPAACDPAAARRTRPRRAAARLERSGTGERRRTRCGLHDAHLPGGHDLHALPRGQEPRARGMGGSRRPRRGRFGDVRDRPRARSSRHRGRNDGSNSDHGRRRGGHPRRLGLRGRRGRLGRSRTHARNGRGQRRRTGARVDRGSA